MALWDIAARVLQQLTPAGVGLTIQRNSAGATGSIQEWQDETGTMLSRIRADGKVISVSGVDMGTGGGSAESAITGGGSGSAYQIWNAGAGAYLFKAYTDRTEIAAVRPGSMNPYNGLSDVKFAGRQTVSGKPATANTWVANDYFIDSKGVSQLCTTGGALGTAVFVSGGWQLAGFWLAASALQTSGAVTIATFDELMIVVRIVSPLSATDIPALRFNGDTANNYLSRYITCASGAVTMLDAATNTTSMARLSGLSTTQERTITAIISNKSASTKLGVVNSNIATGAVATSPSIDIAGGFEWVNTAAQITSVTMLTAGGTATMPIDSGFMVFGRDFA